MDALAPPGFWLVGTLWHIGGGYRRGDACGPDGLM